jgi:thiamine-phosphate pyrophosphorylase
MMKKTIQKGIYLVVDASMDEGVLLSKIRRVIDGKIVAVQIWDNFTEDGNKKGIVKEITALCHQQNVPVLINNQWELLLNTDLDGVHFDAVPENFNQIRTAIGKERITGITCGNDLSIVKWAGENGLDYISFCSIFPSSTANSCELVSFDTIKAARTVTSLPIFLAGGIKPGNVHLLNELDYSGIAVVSGIMSADNPNEAIEIYHQHVSSQIK